MACIVIGSFGADAGPAAISSLEVKTVERVEKIRRSSGLGEYIEIMISLPKTLFVLIGSIMLNLGLSA